MFYSWLCRLALPLCLIVVLTACTGSESVVEPGPGQDESTTTTVEEEVVELDPEDGELETSDTSTTTTTAVDPQEDDAAGSGSGGGVESPTTTFVVDETSDNADAFIELAGSGLVLTIDEQGCADETAAAAVEAGSGELAAVVDAIRTCASAAAIDEFASVLIVAGGAALPGDEAACVSSRLQSGDEYQAFWAALLQEDPFDFLLADLEVQNRYLDLYSECVSVGRAVGEQAAVTLSAPSVGCIDDLYRDREFVRVTIEADLSGNAEDLERVSGQIATCLTTEERDLLGVAS